MGSGRELTMTLQPVQPDDHAAVLAVSGEVDTASVDALRAELSSLVDAGHGRVVLDLTGLRFLDSAGLGALVATHRRLLSRGGGLVVVCPNDLVLRVFKVTGLDDVFAMHRSLDSALGD